MHASMIRAPLLLPLVTMLALGCGGGAPAPKGAPPVDRATTTGSPDKKTPGATLLDAAEKAIRAKDWATASKKIAEARRVAGEGEVTRAVYLETSLHAYRGDYEAAGKVLSEHLKVTSSKRNEPT